MTANTVGNLNFKICLICQKNTEDALIENPISHEKVLRFLEQRNTYGDRQYSHIWNMLQHMTPENLALNKTTWHRKCYQDLFHVGKLKRLQARYESQSDDPICPKRKVEETKLTRSQTSPYNKDACFFCNEVAGYREALHSLSTTSAGQSIRDAVEISGNQLLRIKLSTAIDANDAHAIDIKYHSKCYVNNVTSVLRRSRSPPDGDNSNMAAKVEFIDITESALREGKPLNMAELEETYTNILHENKVPNPSCSRKMLKQLVLTEIPGVEFHRPKRMNEPELLTVKETRDESIFKSSEDAFFKDNEMKTIYHAVLTLRNCINKAEKWVFRGCFDDVNDQHMPKELYYLFKWLIQAPKDFHSTGRIHCRFDSVFLELTYLICTIKNSSLKLRSMALKNFIFEFYVIFLGSLIPHQCWVLLVATYNTGTTNFNVGCIFQQLATSITHF
jgi:hypothetical protein